MKRTAKFLEQKKFGTFYRKFIESLLNKSDIQSLRIETELELKKFSPETKQEFLQRFDTFAKKLEKNFKILENYRGKEIELIVSQITTFKNKKPHRKIKNFLINNKNKIQYRETIPGLPVLLISSELYELIPKLGNFSSGLACPRPKGVDFILISVPNNIENPGVEFILYHEYHHIFHNVSNPKEENSNGIKKNKESFYFEWLKDEMIAYSLSHTEMTEIDLHTTLAKNIVSNRLKRKAKYFRYLADLFYITHVLKAKKFGDALFPILQKQQHWQKTLNDLTDTLKNNLHKEEWVLLLIQNRLDQKELIKIIKHTVGIKLNKEEIFNIGWAEIKEMVERHNFGTDFIMDRFNRLNEVVKSFGANEIPISFINNYLESRTNYSPEIVNLLMEGGKIVLDNKSCNFTLNPTDLEKTISNWTNAHLIFLPGFANWLKRVLEIFPEAKTIFQTKKEEFITSTIQFLETPWDKNQDPKPNILKYKALMATI